MIKPVLRYFDKLEDRVRNRLSKYPIIYSLIGGTAIVLFWRGVWITADEIALSLPDAMTWVDGPLSVLVSVLILLATGLFVSFFVNDQIILSGVNKDKKIVEKTEAEVREEAMVVRQIKEEVDQIEKDIKELNGSSTAEILND